MNESKILIVEDERIIAADLSDRLRRMGYEPVGMAHRGDQAIAMAEALRPDLVLMDIRLEGEMDGITAAREINRRFRIPSIFLSAYAEPATVERAKLAEPFGYLLKPFDDRELHANVEMALFRHRMEEEKAKLEGQLREAQKMEAVGRLAGGVAHELNNKLQTILGNTEELLGTTAPDDPHADSLRDVMAAARHSAAQTRKLLAFARRQTIVPQVLDLNDTIAKMLPLLRRLVGDEITFAWNPGADLGPVRLDPSQLDQILSPLASNARDATTGAGTVTLETGNVEVRADHRPFDLAIAPGAYVVLTVSDTGCGMDQETLAHLFEPFFTTKPVGQGIGLDLAAMYGIVKQNNGIIHVTSALGKGTTFRIYLPRHQAEAVTAGEKPIAAKPATGGSTILLVDDDSSVLRISRRTLESLGHTVLTADDPSEALRLAAEYKGEIQLLLTDVAMPEMSGLDLGERLQVTRPQLKRLYMSGYTIDSIPDRDDRQQELHFIQKPFCRAELAAKLRELLEAKN